MTMLSQHPTILATRILSSIIEGKQPANLKLDRDDVYEAVWAARTIVKCLGTELLEPEYKPPSSPGPAQLPSSSSRSNSPKPGAAPRSSEHEGRWVRRPPPIQEALIDRERVSDDPAYEPHPLDPRLDPHQGPPPRRPSMH